ncbi:actin-like ATPase domain-containing protein [Delitschia confertaspora ATCC 74209]|uniref:Actin-like ATPase domain-containing protein n=1 Tax=Delitschia confertaspora ATCC 74209 TaxID=1513339 RepID=A0A9P4JGZ9_9PLEO|nr:actin-like ATPase domain-containing protein [Delitschia confertaspora ATCC 74209]
MVGKKSGRALLREEGLERTDNNLDLTTWPQVNMINQKNYYTEFLKRDDQYLAYRSQTEEVRNRMIREARDKDRAMAQGVQADDSVMDMDDAGAEDVTVSSGSKEAYASKLIVLHVGSQNLRIGLGTDALPKTVPMVIARKWDQNESEEDGGEPRPKRLKLDGVVPDAAHPEKWFGEDFRSQYQTMCSELRVRMRNNKRRVLPNSKDLVVNYNRRTPPETISEHNDPNRIEWTELPADPKKAPDFFTGHAALRIPEASNPRYKLFWPIRNGTFNERDYRDRNQIYHDISRIFEEAFKSQLGISNPKDLANYNCVFIIPDLYERVYVTMMLDILIRDLGLGKVCLQQESLSATFGAGVSISCIVDIGAQKTSICCVDEGLCIEDSRINLKMGGEDVTETFVKMMISDHFPYADMNLKRRYDFLLAEDLKRRFCTMDEASITVQTYDFHLRAAGQDTRKYFFKTYDETMLAPMGFFKPAIFDHSKKLEFRRKIIPRSVDLYDGSPNDPISTAQIAVIEAAAGHPTTNGTQDSVNSTNVASTPSRQPFNLLSRLHDAEATPRSSVAGSPVPDGTPNPDRDTPAIGDADKPISFHDPVLEKIKVAEERDKTLPIMPLDKAIIESISHGARGDDRKMRDFFGGIMLIGGGSKIIGLPAFLETRIKEVKSNFQKEILIGAPPRELDPQVLTWKGGSVFGKLSSSGNDSWISRAEYDMLGSRLLVSKCMFAW